VSDLVDDDFGEFLLNDERQVIFHAGQQIEELIESLSA
jgi:hypothetical protein